MKNVNIATKNLYTLYTLPYFFG